MAKSVVQNTRHCHDDYWCNVHLNCTIDVELVAKNRHISMLRYAARLQLPTVLIVGTMLLLYVQACLALANSQELLSVYWTV
jgi:hypothetical protein